MKRYQGMKGFAVMGLFLSLFCSFGSLAMAQDEAGGPLKLGVAQALTMALEASEDLKISANAVLQKISKEGEERGYARPFVIGQVGWSNYFQYPDSAAGGIKEYYFDSGVTATQTLFTFGKVTNAVSSAKKAVSASRFNKEAVAQDVIYQTKMAYLGALLAQRILNISQESYEHAQENKTILEERSMQGRVSKYDNIKILADIAARLPVVNNARANFISALETLKVAIGVNSEDVVELSDGFVQDFSALNRELLIVALRDRQPAIKALAETIEEKEYLVKSKKATLFPEISAFATWNYKGYGNEYYVGGDHLDDYGVAGIKVTVPLWVGGIDREKLYQEKLNKKDAELKYAKGKKDYVLLLEKAIVEYTEYLKTLAAHEDAVRLAEEAFFYSRELFGSGQISVTDLNDAELQLTNAKINQERTLYNLNATLALLERLTLMEKTHE